MALEPPKLNHNNFNHKLGRLKYMQSFYEKKLDMCEERQKGLFEDLIAALKYTISFMEEAKAYSDAYWKEHTEEGESETPEDE